MREEFGSFSEIEAASAFAGSMQGQRTDSMLELTYADRKRIHNLKYYTWIEQQGKETEELNAQWYDRSYWTRVQSSVDEIDALIASFNRDVLS